MSSHTLLLLPPELLSHIISLVHSPLGVSSFSLASRNARTHALPAIFGTLKYSGMDVVDKVRRVNAVGEDVKAVITKLELTPWYKALHDVPESSILFSFISSLPCLHSVEFRQPEGHTQPSPFPPLFNALRGVPLRELIIDMGKVYSFLEVPLFQGLSDLEKLKIKWMVRDDRAPFDPDSPEDDEDDDIPLPSIPGTSLAQLTALIQPSLKTLVSLRVDNCNDTPKAADLDLEGLRDAGETLREFEYSLRSGDVGVLDSIVRVLPYLTKLGVRWRVKDCSSPQWNPSYIDTLSKLTHLTSLTLSFDLDTPANDPGTAPFPEAQPWYTRSYTRRFKAAEDLAKACRQLQECRWLQLDIPVPTVNYRAGPGLKLLKSDLIHRFIIIDGEGRRKVRGLEQWWMSRNGAKVEELPGNVLRGYGDPEEQVDEV